MSTIGEAPVIRRATTGDMSRLIDFVDVTYGKGAPFKGYNRQNWQFQDTPFKRESSADPTIWIATVENKIIGTIAVQDGSLWLAGRTVPAGWVVDVMVHPEIRGQGLSHKIHDLVMMERDLLVTLTMAAATRRVAERAGCLTLGPVGQFILPNRLSGRTVARFLNFKSQFGSPLRRRALSTFAATGLGPALIGAGARTIAAIRQSGTPALDATRRTRIIEIDYFPDEVDDLWNRLRPKFPASFERSAKFLNWRFVACPDLKYRRFLLYRDNQLAGYLVTRTGEPVELPVGVVVDVFTNPDDTEALDLLVAHGMEVLRPKAEYLEAAASHPAWQKALRRAGFLPTRTMRPTIVCTQAELRSELEDMLDNWHFTKADHDWDQVHPF